MGSYSHLTVGGYRIFESKGVWDAQTTLFTPKDRVVWQRPLSERLGYEPGEHDDFVDLATLESTEPAIVYRATVRQCIDRLSVRGNTLEKASLEYEQGRSQILECFQRDRVFLDEMGLDLGVVLSGEERWTYDIETSLFEGDENIYRNLSFEVWLEELRSYVRLKIDPPSGPHSNDPNGFLSEYHSYINRSGDFDRYMGFLSKDYLMLLRCLLEVVDRDSLVELDISWLILDGALDECQEIARTQPYFTILTEGSSDKWILERSMAILFPHLAPYYKFADFETSKLPGGVASNVLVIRTFIALTIQDRLIVLFDNDAAGNNALRTLGAIPLPDNVRVMTLPKLELAANYPVLGPNGSGISDVNSQAVSIEFFLGEDILRKHGAFPPVGWKSFQPELNLYQGEVTMKNELLEDYNRLLSEPSRYASHDWSSMRHLLQSIFRSFM